MNGAEVTNTPFMMRQRSAKACQGRRGVRRFRLRGADESVMAREADGERPRRAVGERELVLAHREAV